MITLFHGRVKVLPLSCSVQLSCSLLSSGQSQERGVASLMTARGGVTDSC